jgi:hypothetical protein
MKRFLVTSTFEIDISLDESLLPDDEWRQNFYPSLRTLADMAEWLAVQCGIHEQELNSIDGCADRDPGQVDVERVEIVDSDVVELD